MHMHYVLYLILPVNLAHVYSYIPGRLPVFLMSIFVEMRENERQRLRVFKFSSIHDPPVLFIDFHTLLSLHRELLD